MFNRKLLFLALLGLSVFLFTTPAVAEVKFGGRAGAYFDANSAFVGGEALANVFGERWFFNPNVEYVFIDRGSEWTFNFDFHYDLPTENLPVYLWIGAGPAIIFVNPDRPLLKNDTSLGVNLLFGVGFRLHDSDIIPYIQPKIILSNNSEFSLAFGIRF